MFTMKSKRNTRALDIKGESNLTVDLFSAVGSNVRDEADNEACEKHQARQSKVDSLDHPHLWANDPLISLNTNEYLVLSSQ